MFQNSNTKKLRNISNQIDSQISKIDRLLSKISKKTIKTKRTNKERENRSQRQQVRSDVVKNQQEDKFNQTAYIYQEENYEYKFRDVEAGGEDEQLLLEDYQNGQQKQYVSRINVDQPITIAAQVKYNWVQKYLDHGDCELCIDTGKQTIEIIGVQNGIVSCISQGSGFFKVEMAEIYKYDFVCAKFTNHTQAVRLNTCLEGQSQLYELRIKQTTRLVMKVDNLQRSMQRILIIKESQGQEGLRYELAWGSYFESNLTQLITLAQGKYIIMTLGVQPLEYVELYFQKLDCLEIKVACQQPLKTRNILMKTFLETYTDGYQPSARDIQPQYVRNVYMDIGIVVQTYENIYRYEAKFQDEQPNKEDICLLFPKLYSPKQVQNRLRAGQKIVKFYSIQQKPAKLFVPRKYVVMGSKVMETMKVHSVFK